jgi:uncharacterized membrane protein YuzA (DUF378 family)
MGTLRFLYNLSTTILIIGGINWGLVGLSGIDFISLILGEGTLGARFIYILTGLCAIILGGLKLILMCQNCLDINYKK